MVGISADINIGLYNALNKKCEELNISKSEFIRKSLAESLGFLEKNDTSPKSNILDNLKKAFNSNDIELIENDVKIPLKLKHHQKDNDIWKLSNSRLDRVKNYKERKFFLDYDTGIIKYSINNGSKGYPTCSLNEVLVFEECSPITYRDVRNVKKILGWSHDKNPQIYLWQQGVFNNIISDFKVKVTDCNFKIVNDSLRIMGEKTYIPSNTVKEIVNIIGDKGFSELLVYRLCKSYNQYNELYIRIICENYDNPELLKLLKNDDTAFVENNPSKRRNMIRNGGL